MKDNRPPFAKEPALGLLKCMVRIRRFEEKIIEVYGEQDMKTPVHLCIGQEAVSAGVMAHLGPRDTIFPTHRGHGHCLAKGMEPESLYAEFYGRETGCCRGRGGSMHPCSTAHGVPGTSAIVGGGIPLAVGAALGARLRGENLVSVALFGDGASEEGTFHESLNFAALKQLPVVFVCENNLWATNSPLSARQPNPDIYRRAAGYGIPARAVDGNDALEVHAAAKEAVDRARTGGGPTLLECKTYRWKSHVGPEPDHDKGARTREELDAWTKKCPIRRLRDACVKNRGLTAEQYEAMVREVDHEMDTALRTAKAAPLPDPATLLDHVYHAKEAAR